MEDIDRSAPHFEGTLPCKLVRIIAPSHASSTTSLSSLSMTSGSGSVSTSPVTETKQVDMTLRLYGGAQMKSSAGRQRMLYLEMSDPTEQSIYVWMCTEADFPSFASDNSLLIAFEALPTLLASLFSSVSNGTSMDSQSTGATNRFAAVLTVRDTAASNTASTTANSASACTFAITETNAFKQMTHVSLTVRQANDAVVKRYLSARVAHWSDLAQRTIAQLQDAQAELSRIREVNESGMAEITRLRTEIDARESKLKLTHAKEVSEMREKAMEYTTELETKHRDSLNEMAVKHEAIVAALRERCEHADATINALTVEKSSLESRIRELSSALASAQSDASTAQNEAAKCKALLTDSESVRITQAKELSAAMTRVAVLEQSVSDKTELLDRATSQLAAAEESRKTLDESLSLYKNSCTKQQQKLETCVAEIHRGNSIIQKLQEECKTLKAKSKAKSENIRLLEATVNEKTAALDAQLRELTSVKGELSKEKSGREAAESNIAALKTQLAEARDAIANNQQVISWLNKELNDVHTIPGSASSSSHHHFAGMTTTSAAGLYTTPLQPLSSHASIVATSPTPPPSSIPRLKASSTLTTPPSHTSGAYISPEQQPATHHSAVTSTTAAATTTTASTARQLMSTPPLSTKTPPKPSPSAGLLAAKDTNPYLQPLLQQPQQARGSSNYNNNNSSGSGAAVMSMVAGGSPGSVVLPQQAKTVSSLLYMEGYTSTAPAVST